MFIYLLTIFLLGNTNALLERSIVDRCGNVYCSTSFPDCIKPITRYDGDLALSCMSGKKICGNVVRTFTFYFNVNGMGIHETRIILGPYHWAYVLKNDVRGQVNWQIIRSAANTFEFVVRDYANEVILLKSENLCVFVKISNINTPKTTSATKTTTTTTTTTKTKSQTKTTTTTTTITTTSKQLNTTFRTTRSSTYFIPHSLHQVRYVTLIWGCGIALVFLMVFVFLIYKHRKRCCCKSHKVHDFAKFRERNSNIEMDVLSDEVRALHILAKDEEVFLEFHRSLLDSSQDVDISPLAENSKL